MSTTHFFNKMIKNVKESFLKFLSNIILPTPYRELPAVSNSSSSQIEYTNYQKKEDLVKALDDLKKVDLIKYNPKKGSMLMVLTFSKDIVDLTGKINVIADSIMEFTAFNAIDHNIRLNNQYLDLMFVDSSGKYIDNSKLNSLIEAIDKFTNCIANYRDMEYGVEEHNLRTLAPVVISLTSILRGLSYCSTNQ